MHGTQPYLFYQTKIQIIKKKSDTQKKKRSTHTKRERKIDIGRDREQQAKKEHTTLGGDFISPFLL